MNKESKKEILCMTYPLISRSLSSRDNQKALLALTQKKGMVFHLCLDCY